MTPDKRLPMPADGGTAPPKGSTSHCQAAPSTSWGFPALPANLNPSNRPVRTRMPGGVAGDVELKSHAPMPIATTCRSPRALLLVLRWHCHDRLLDVGAF